MSTSNLFQAAERIFLQPTTVTDGQTQTFMDEFPFDVLIRELSTHQLTAEQVAVVSKALSRVLSTDLGKHLLPAGLPQLQAALQSPDVPLRKFGCEQIGNILVAAPSGVTQGSALSSLMQALQDPDTGVAAAASAALSSFLSHQEHFQLLVQGAAGHPAELSQLAASSDAVVRTRVLELLVGAAGKDPERLQLLKSSGLLGTLLSEFRAPSDVLSTLAALHTLKDVAETASSGVALLLCDTVLPLLLPLLDDPPLRSNALPVAATMLAHAGEAALQLPGCQALVGVLAAVLDEQGDYNQEDELVALDAAGQMGLSQPTAELLLSTPQIADRLLDRALSSTSTSALTVAALHAVASLAGLARAGHTSDGPQATPAASMSQQAEDQLRVSTFTACSSSSPPKIPSECVSTLVSRPFPEVRAAAYRFISALAVRAWFARELSNNAELLDRILNPSSESGQQLCEWRHSAVVSLNLGLGNGAHDLGMNGASSGMNGVVGAMSSLADRVALAVKAGPYGAGLTAAQHVPEVASLPS